MLAIKNAHERDKDITFDEGPHIYTVRGEQGYTSVTTWNHEHFSKFDSAKILGNILRSPKMKDPSYKYYGMTAEEILKSWDDNRDSAATAGTQTHYNIECFYNGMDVKDESIELRIAQGLRQILSGGSHVNVTSYNRMVLLTGEVGSAAEKQRAELLAKSQENVSSVVNDLAVEPARTRCRLFDGSSHYP